MLSSSPPPSSSQPDPHDAETAPPPGLAANREPSEDPTVEIAAMEAIAAAADAAAELDVAIDVDVEDGAPAEAAKR